jgi:hypothetical protein
MPRFPEGFIFIAAVRQIMTFTTGLIESRTEGIQR